jgi:hypothetical protein
MRGRFLNIACATTVLISTCLISAKAQQSPVMDTGVASTGPNSNQADYRYLSMATPRASSLYDFSYNLCNLRQRNMAFYWVDVGFGMDVSDPLPAGLCATYDRVGSGRKLKSKTTLKFSSGSQSPPAYLPCEGESECASNAAPLQSIFASFRGFIMKRLEGVPETNRPTSVVSPLRVVVRVTSQGDTRELRVDWAGSGVKFVAYFPDSKLEPGELKRLLITKIGGRFDFDTFPAFKSNSNLLLAGDSRAALTVSPGDAVQSGTIVFLISKGFPPTRDVAFLVVDESGRPVARIDAPLPPATR